MNRKLVVFVPPASLDAVRDALFAAGAGRIGDYERCSWYTEGTGTFLGGEGTDPTIGERGREERVPELRLETVYPADREDEVVRALRVGASVRGAGVRPLRAAVKARLFTDGGARGNPGPAAYAYVLEADDGTVLAAEGHAIGVATNNVAEYRALVEGLRRAAELHVDELEVVSDSELLVHQMRGEWKIKKDTLRALWEEAQDLAGRIGQGALHGRAARAQRARRPARERGARRGRRLSVRTISVEERRARLARRHFLAPGSRARDAVELAGGLVGLHATDPATVFLSARARGVEACRARARAVRGAKRPADDRDAADAVRAPARRRGRCAGGLHGVDSGRLAQALREADRGRRHRIGRRGMARRGGRGNAAGSGGSWRGVRGRVVRRRAAAPGEDSISARARRGRAARE